MKYKVRLTETLVSAYVVEADTPEKAAAIIQDDLDLSADIQTERVAETEGEATGNDMRLFPVIEQDPPCCATCFWHWYDDAMDREFCGNEKSARHREYTDYRDSCDNHEPEE